MKSIFYRCVIATLIALLIGLNVAKLNAQEIQVMLPLIESGGKNDAKSEQKPVRFNDPNLAVMVPVADCSQPNTIVWGAIDEDPEPQYEIFVSNRDGTDIRWNGYSKEPTYTFSGDTMPERIQLARKDGSKVSGWTAWYTLKECLPDTDETDTTPQANASRAVNNLTTIQVREENAPFFTLIWKDSPNGGSATVDVYAYNSSGRRNSIATNKWDNSGWLNGNDLLCAACGNRSVNIANFGTVSLGSDETLFELVWHGTDDEGNDLNLSTYVIIDADLNWSLATADSNDDGTDPPDTESGPSAVTAPITNGNFDDATDAEIVGWITSNDAVTRWNQSGRYLVSKFAKQKISVSSGGAVTFTTNAKPDTGSESTTVRFELSMGGSTSVISVDGVNGWDSFSDVHTATFDIPAGISEVTLTIRLGSNNLARIDNVAIVSQNNTDDSTAAPVLNASEYGAGLSYARVFSDEFETDGTVGAVMPEWRFVEMGSDYGLHWSGNFDLNANGEPGGYAYGKRWSAWYNSPDQDDFTYVRDGNLNMGGRYSNDPDPTRRPYQDKGMNVRFDQHKFYTSYLTSWDATWNANTGRWQTKPGSVENVFGPGSFFEMRVSFAEMQTRAFRLSFWLMPAFEDGNDTYDTDYANGVEIDLFEYEFSPGWEDTLLMKVISNENAPAGSWTPNSFVNASDYDINIQDGFHTVGLLWLDNALVWYLDGEEVQRDTDRIPAVPHYMIISREMNSGAVTPETAQQNPDKNHLVMDAPYRPYDYGLYAYNIWHDRDKVNDDQAKIDYVRVWSVR